MEVVEVVVAVVVVVVFVVVGVLWVANVGQLMSQFGVQEADDQVADGGVGGVGSKLVPLDSKHST